MCTLKRTLFTKALSLALVCFCSQTVFASECLFRLWSPSGGKYWVETPPLGGRVGEVLAPVLGPLLRVPRLKLFVDRASVNSEQNPHLFFTEMLRDLNISYRPHPHSAAEQTSESIPSEGPVVVVANHPLGFADAMIMADFIAKQRTDYKILGNALLKHAVPEAVTEHLIAVDLWSGAGVREQQQRIMEESRRQLEQGVVIGIFPSGAASLPVETSSGRVILDEEWKTGVARMIA